MEIILAKNRGFCFGVKRAVDMSVKALKEKPKPCQMIGPLVHNEFVIEKLKKQGIKFINSLNEAKKETIIIPAHGEDPAVLEKIINMGLAIVDTTCPLVKKVQNLARTIKQNGNQIIIIGEKGHKEVNSIQAAIKNKGIILENEKEAQKIKIKNKSITVITQTTQNPERVNKIIKILKRRFKRLKLYNTLCPNVLRYQKEAKELAKKVDLTLVIGSKTSANTKRMTEIAKTSGKPVYHIENPSQLKRKWFSGIKKVGVTTGTSTPEWLVEEVVRKLQKI